MLKWSSYVHDICQAYSVCLNPDVGPACKPLASTLPPGLVDGFDLFAKFTWLFGRYQLSASL